MAVWNLIGEIAGEKIVLLCTHVVQDVEFIARELILMNQGLAIRRGSPHALEQELEGQVWELTAAEAQLPQHGAIRHGVRRFPAAGGHFSAATQ